MEAKHLDSGLKKKTGRGATAKQAALSKKQSLRHHIFSKIRVVGHSKMINSRLAACFHVAGVQICLLDTNKISSPNI